MEHYACIMGLDPGLSGAVAFYYPSHPENIACYDMPIVDRRVNGAALYDIIQQHRPSLAVIEAVHSMPGQGVSSSFNFGVSYGIAQGVVSAAKIPVVFVSPGKWKKYFLLSSDKEASRGLAINKWPASDHFRKKKDEGRAEAALLALYGHQTQR